MNLTINEGCKSTNSEFVNTLVQVTQNSRVDISVSDLLL
jgi:hypothetical protein